MKRDEEKREKQLDNVENIFLNSHGNVKHNSMVVCPDMQTSTKYSPEPHSLASQYHFTHT